MMNSVDPKISVIIPVKNEACKIRACIDGILRQTISVLEILVLDSGSTDGTLDILREYEEVEIINIPSSEFNHGSTRNVGVNSAKGDYCLLTVGDAEPCDDRWIENLLNGFVDDRVSAVCGQQVVPHDLDKNPVEWFRPVSKPEITTFYYSKAEFEKLSPNRKKNACAWDDVTSLYRRDALISIPFRHTTYAEDAQWAKDALMFGYKISYNYSARVFHYHKKDPSFIFDQGFTVCYHMYKFFGIVPAQAKFPIKQKIKILKILCFAKNISFVDKISWWNYNLDLVKNENLAILKFMLLLEKGDRCLDEYHLKKYSSPPVPLKN